MTPEQLADTLAASLDGEYDDEHDVFTSASAAGRRVYVTVKATIQTDYTRRFTLTIEEASE